MPGSESPEGREVAGKKSRAKGIWPVQQQEPGLQSPRMSQREDAVVLCPMIGSQQSLLGSKDSEWKAPVFSLLPAPPSTYKLQGENIQLSTQVHRWMVYAVDEATLKAVPVVRFYFAPSRGTNPGNSIVHRKESPTIL